MLSVAEITRMHDETITRWHQDPASPAQVEAPALLLNVATVQHRANFDLWHEEDKARDPSATDNDIAVVKHAIDALNQRRNDLVETIDRMLLAEAATQNENAPLHSETPGLIVDRLSILALRIYHTEEESRRDSASDEHRQKNSDRLALLQEQRSDLAACLHSLWLDIRSGKRRFKLYRQMKMYNDPDLNPAVYMRKPGA